MFESKKIESVRQLFDQRDRIGRSPVPNDNALGAHGIGVLGLVHACREEGRLGAAMDRELQRYMPQPAEPNNCEALARTQVTVLHRGKGDDARA